MKQEEKVLSKQQLARHLQVSEMTIDRWRKQGMPWHRMGVKLVRFDLAKVNAWLDQRAEMDFSIVNKNATSD